ncbi:unnamed protein product [Alternaria alternata]
MAPPTLTPRRQSTRAHQPPQDGVQAARGMLQESDYMHNATSYIKEATSALQFGLPQQLEVLNNDRARMRATMAVEADAQAAEIKTQAAKIKTLTADKKTLEADLYNERMRNKKTEQDLKKAEQALKEERTRNSANRDAVQRMREIMAKTTE